MYSLCVLTLFVLFCMLLCVFTDYSLLTLYCRLFFVGLLFLLSGALYIGYCLMCDPFLLNQSNQKSNPLKAVLFSLLIASLDTVTSSYVVF